MLINSIPSSGGFGVSVADWAVPAVIATLE